MYVLGIDPGLTNMGLALYDNKRDCFIRAENVGLSYSPETEGKRRCDWSMQQVISSFVKTLSRWLTQFQDYPLGMIVVESQFKPMMCGLE